MPSKVAVVNRLWRFMCSSAWQEYWRSNIGLRRVNDSVRRVALGINRALEAANSPGAGNLERNSRRRAYLKAIGEYRRQISTSTILTAAILRGARAEIFLARKIR